MSSEALEVDLVLFEIAGTRFGVDLTQVRRVERVEPLEAVAEVLGRPVHGHRALVFAAADGGERKLAIDQMLGVRTVGVGELRRMPPAAAGASYSVGAWLDGNDAVLLIDLQKMPLTAPGSPNG